MSQRDYRYRGRIVDLAVEQAELPDGRTVELEVVHHPGGAAAVLVDGQGQVCLLRQYRHAVGGWLWELPAGKLESHEPPLETARREAEEEAGVHAEDWYSLGTLTTSPGVLNEVIHLYLAQTLSPVPQRLEAHELIEVHWLPFTEALERARSSEITDAKTVAGLFRAAPLIK